MVDEEVEEPLCGETPGHRLAVPDGALGRGEAYVHLLARDHVVQALGLTGEVALLVGVGDENRLTMESIASRAGTGIAVLYRRWANKDELVLAALEHYRNNHPIDLPDTGTLRGDLHAALTAMGEARAAFFAVAAASAFAGLLAGAGLTLAQARDRIMGDQRLARVQTIYQRAHDRGEIDLERIPATVLAMPFDLVRHDLLMDLTPVAPTRIQSIVDEIFLPLVRTRTLDH